MEPVRSRRDVPLGYLDSIPSSWDDVRLGSILRERKLEVGSASGRTKLLSLTMHGVIPRDLDNVVGKMPASFDTYQHVRTGDIVFCLFDVQETPRTVGLATEDGMITGAYTVTVVAKESAHPGFVSYAYLAYDQHKALRPLYAGLRNTIRSGDFRNIRIPFPPLHEQVRIATYLDRETAEIDAFIGDQEKLIELLTERRTNAIARAVSGRVVTHGPRRDSGSPWLGEVPAHWEIGRVAYAFRLTLGKMVNAGTAEGEPRPYLRAGNIQESGVDLNEVKMMPATAQDVMVLSLRRNDVVVVEGGAGYGRSDVLREDLDGWIFQNHVIRARALGNHSPGYLNYLVKAARGMGHFKALGSFATIPNLSAERLCGLEYPMIPLAEQEAIAEHLDRETTDIDAAIADSREAIALSKERRAALISAAVTGKIDVREHRTAKA
ncbi:restriction endonuclease subunit S [Pseudoclavibacter helvolus]|uniref:restriction endonuclease subunit S n=1 Tax=Pseudoclavibacter helvolus TaxID=255205 RepID=UPI001FC8ED2D|nr:restriction endonuclease subunit S [Pseudoclavibacter helvolus]